VANAQVARRPLTPAEGESLPSEQARRGKRRQRRRRQRGAAWAATRTGARRRRRRRRRNQRPGADAPSAPPCPATPLSHAPRRLVDEDVVDAPAPERRRVGAGVEEAPRRERRRPVAVGRRIQVAADDDALADALSQVLSQEVGVLPGCPRIHVGVHVGRPQVQVTSAQVGVDGDPRLEGVVRRQLDRRADSKAMWLNRATPKSARPSARAVANVDVMPSRSASTAAWSRSSERAAWRSTCCSITTSGASAARSSAAWSSEGDNAARRFHVTTRSSDGVSAPQTPASGATKTSDEGTQPVRAARATRSAGAIRSVRE